MRECYAYRHPVKRMLDTKWILKLIEEEARGLLAEKQAAEDKKVSIDYSQLAKIRRDAAVTQDKLIVEEEAWKPNRIQPRKCSARRGNRPNAPEPGGVPTAPVPPVRQGLWLGARLGLMLSRSGGRINEKLFDEFADSVLTLDNGPELIEDYIQDLKEGRP